MLKKSENLIVKKESNGTVCTAWYERICTIPPEKNKKDFELKKK
jgi:hypothetical protein